MLNKLLIDYSRCLLQYMGDCWPWTDADSADEQAVIKQLMQRQQVHIGRLAELLMNRQGTLDLGNFSHDFTGLHYVALDYLMDQLIASETALIEQLDNGLKGCGDDSEATAILQQAVADERENLAKLEELAQSHSAA